MATDSDRRAMPASSKVPGQSPPTIRVSAQGWPYGKMGHFFPSGSRSARCLGKHAGVFGIISG